MQLVDEAYEYTMYQHNSMGNNASTLSEFEEYADMDGGYGNLPIVVGK